MSKYLYGASIQGIQEFIFKTNKLREITGASEIINSITGLPFLEKFVDKEILENNLIQNAAGIVKIVFDELEDAKKIVLEFPKEVYTKAPGIVVSQAMVKINGDLVKAIDYLEIKLEEERNKRPFPTEIGFMGIERSRRTGGALVVIGKNNRENLDSATKAKLDNADSFELFRNGLKEDVSKEQIKSEIDDISGGSDKKWIAVVHADGNGLGLLIQNMGKVLKDMPILEQITFLHDFSTQLDNSTKAACKISFTKCIEKEIDRDYGYPIRPVILGGDDLTVIVRADLALDFTSIFLKEFQKETKERLKSLYQKGLKVIENGLSACAGIAYVKKAYPFHYAIDLAEQLCKSSKKHVKKGINPLEMPVSALEFYKVNDSFIQPLSDMKKRTHELKQENTNNEISFNAGPYLVHGNKNSEHNLCHLVKLMAELEKFENKNNNKGLGKIRQLVDEYHTDPARAAMFLDRISEINPELGKIIKDMTYTSDTGKISHMQDILHLMSFRKNENN